MKKNWGKSIAVIMTCIMLFLCISNTNVTAEEQPDNNADVFAELAFPTAEGNGKYVNGFRGGIVVRVTNLNDSGEGSLRWALEEVSGPRIVVFAVGGVIELESEIVIDEDHGNVYIAGQTAPGDGITIIKDGIYLDGTNDVVIRNLRIRHGAELNPSSCIDIIHTEDCIVDHCSMSWSNGPIYNSRYSNNVTLQNCILSEPLIDAYTGIDDGPQGYYSIGTGILTDSGSIHHNLVSNCMNRNMCFWKIKDIESSAIAVVNNSFFNWYYYGFQWHSLSLEIINNTLKSGTETTSDYIFTIKDDYDGSFHFNGNVLDNIIKDWDLVKLEGVSEEQLSKIKYDEPIISSDTNIESAENSYEKVLSNSGAIVPELDDIDKRYIREIQNGEATYTGSKTGMKGFLNSVEDAEGYPDETTFKGGEAPLDSDEDGMPDEWEIFMN